jgi:hypothetical protein
MNAIAEQLSRTEQGRELSRTSRLYIIAQRELEKTHKNAFRAQRPIADAVTRENLSAALCGEKWRELHDAYGRKVAEAREDLRILLRDLERKHNETCKTLVEVEAYQLARKVAEDMNQGGNALNGKSGASVTVPNGAIIGPPRSSQAISADAGKADAVRDREGMGRSPCANGLEIAAHPPRDTNDDAAGLCMRAEKASERLPAASSPELNGGGRAASASNGQTNGAPSRETDAPPLGHNKPPRFMPGHARRGAEAMTAVQHVAAKTLLDTFKVRDGRPVGDVLFKELDGMRAANAREASVLRAIQLHTANAESTDRVRDIVSPAHLEAIVAAATEESQAHAA